MDSQPRRASSHKLRQGLTALTKKLISIEIFKKETKIRLLNRVQPIGSDERTSEREMNFMIKLQLFRNILLGERDLTCG
jgi:hypothetical protein